MYGDTVWRSPNHPPHDNAIAQSPHQKGDRPIIHLTQNAIAPQKNWIDI